jgi:protein-disulfide isomerase
LASLIALGGAVGCETGGENEPRAGVRVDVERYFVPLGDTDHVRGSDLPLVTVIVYSNYACGPCMQLWKTLDEVLAGRGEELRIVARHVDVRGYEAGGLAAEAAAAAASQGKFWEMHAAMVDSSTDLSKPMIFHLAETVGLDVAAFRAELRGGAPQRRRVTEASEARKLGLNAAPVAIINGIPFAGPPAEVAAWNALLDTEVAHARRLIASGVPRAKLYDEIMRNALRQRLPARKKGTSTRGPAKPVEDASKPADRPRASTDRDLTKVVKPKPDARYRVPTEGLPSYGPEDAPVVIIEITDFDCPFCAEAHEVMVGLRDTFPEDVRFAVLNNPLSVHPKARLAARASLAADRQGRYWSFHDALFDPKRARDRDTMITIAQRLGLDMPRFTKDLDDPALGVRVDGERNLAIDLGAVATPAFLINGRFIEGAGTPAQMERVVRSELERAAQLTEAGTKRADLARMLLAGAVEPEAFPNRAGTDVAPAP